LAACVVVEGDVNVGSRGGAAITDLDSGVFRPGTGGSGAVRTSPKSPTPAPTPQGAKATPTPPPLTMEEDAWETQESGTTADLHAIVAKGVQGGRAWAWAVGDNGTILRTADGGQNWRKLASGTAKNLYTVNYFYQPVPGVAGSESYTVLVGGADGTLLISKSSGATWSVLPQPIATKSVDPPGDVRQLDIWPTQSQGASSIGRTSVFVSTARYPLVMSPNASDTMKVVWDEEGKWGSTAAYPIPVRDDTSWPLSLRSSDGYFRFSFFDVKVDRAYGLLLAWDKGKVGFCPEGKPVCIGFPANSQSDWLWRWRGYLAVDGDPTDLATVPDNGFETPCDQGGDFAYVAYLSTTKAIYRTTDYGKNWLKVLNAGADRILATGIGRVTAISSSRVWHGKTVYPTKPANQPACPKEAPTFTWTQAARGSQIDLVPGGNYLGGVRSTDFGKFKNDMWLVGRSGKILFRPGSLE
ncbi:MAG: hypothetical protein FJZ01_11675, partial [Candidatus Sericytochromatia bacterium]|nr:hypothetical protein [Candidatus Tanganyikabacteria bacterium]